MLRDVVEADLPILFEFQRDPEASRMAAFVGKDPSDREAFMGHWKRILADPTCRVMAVVSDWAVVGSVGSFMNTGRREVTYWIGREFWGRGIATAALRSLLSLDTTRPIFAGAAKDNWGSIRVLEKCGFLLVEELRGFANGRDEEIDEVLLRLD